MGIKGKETITILRRSYDATEDDYGNEIAETVTPIIVRNVLIGWGSTADVASIISETITTSAVLYLPNGTLTKDDDRFVFPDGSTWIKDGATIDWTPQFGSPVKTKSIVQVKRQVG